MDVRVRVWLQGGHTWEFICDEADPVLYGLISALPGAKLDEAALPPDGLIQVETRAGERLFLTRSSLVALDIVPVSDELHAINANRLAAPSAALGAGASIPASFVSVSDALPGDLHRKLVDHALGQSESASDQPDDKPCELSLDKMDDAVAQALRSHVGEAREKLGQPGSLPIEIDMGLYAVGPGQSLPPLSNENGALVFVYHFHKQPKAFTGGGVRLFDCTTDNGTIRAGAEFRDVQINDNALLIYPGYVVSPGLPVFGSTDSFSDRLFALRGVSREGAAAASR